jgi:Subtilase family
MACDGSGCVSRLDLSRIRGLDPAAPEILGPRLNPRGGVRDRIFVPFLLHLPDEAARAAFRALPPLEGNSGNGAMVLGGEEAAALTDGAFLPVVAPPEWFARLADPSADGCPALSAFRDAEKTIALSAPGYLPGWLQRLDRKLPAFLSLSEPKAQGKCPEGSVCMGVIDDGIAIVHERFRLKDGSTRVLRSWDQNMFAVDERKIEEILEFPPETQAFNGIDPCKQPLPGEITKERIDEVLGEVPPDQDEDLIYQRLGIIDFTDAEPEFVAHRVSHGTHVADLAAGYDPGDPMAPKRPIIAVQMPNPVVARPIEERRLDFYIWLGICYIVLQADSLAGETNGMPVVINASFGKLAGPHDGTGLIERAIDRLVEARGQKTQVILPAGNQHLSQCHAVVDLAKGKEVTFDWEVLPDDRTFSTVEAWLPASVAGACGLDLKVSTPYGRAFRFSVDRPEEVAIRHLGEDAGRIRLVTNGAGRRMIRIDIGPTEPDLHKPSVFHLAPSGTWKLSFSSQDTGPKSGKIHVWSQRDDTLHGYPMAGRQSYFEHENHRCCAETLHLDAPGGDLAVIDSDSHPEQEGLETPITRTHLLNALASGDHVLVAGAHVARTGRIAAYSAGGPTAPGEASEDPVSRPDCTFPCDESLVLEGILAAGSRTGTCVALSGTSAAAPQLARLVADILGSGAEEKLARISDLIGDAARAATRKDHSSAFAPGDRMGLGPLRRMGWDPAAGIRDLEWP